MRVANLFVGTIAILWVALFWIGRGLARGVYLQSTGIAPSAGQIDYYIVYPLAAVVVLMFAGWVGNIYRNRLLVLIPSFLLGFAILPFLLGYAGGM